MMQAHIFTTCIFILSIFSLQVISKSVDRGNTKAAYVGYVDINGEQYFINSTDFVTKNQAKEMCRSLNMQVVSFEKPGKWVEIQSWFLANQEEPFYSSFWWIGAERKVAQSDFFWDESGGKVEEFFWSGNSPQHEDDLTKKICLEINAFALDGWTDTTYCDIEWSSVLCQPLGTD